MNQLLRQRLLTQAAVDAQQYPADLESAVASALVKVRRRFLLIWVVAISAALALAAGLVVWLLGVVPPPPPPPPPAVTLESIAVTSPAETVNVDTKVMLKATGKYTDGSTRELEKSVSWTSSDEAIATVNAEGVVTAVLGGPVTVTAAAEGVTGSFNLSVAPKDTPAPHSLISLRVTPDTASMDLGGKQQLTALGTYSDGSFATLNVEAVWDTSDRSVAPVDGYGLVTGSRQGTATISATLGGLRGVAAITVTSPPEPLITGLSVDPAALKLKVGKQGQLTAIASYSDGTTKPVTNVKWASDAGKIATVDAIGLVTGNGPGHTTVRATLIDPRNPIEDTATVEVERERSVKSIVVTPAGPLSMNAGENRQLTALVTYDDGKTGSTVAWAVGSQAQGSFPPGAPPRTVVTVTDSGLVTGKAGGQATVTASAGGVTSKPVAVAVRDVAKR